jgi:hypothetical protein
MDENGGKRTKTYESVKTRLKTDKTYGKDENGRKCMKTDENV